MTKSEKKEQEIPLTENSNVQNKESEKKKSLEKKEETIEEKLNNTQEKLLRTLAEMENQRRRFEKEKKEAFEFGGFNFASEALLLIDNIDRAIISFKNDEKLKNNKDLDKIIDGIEIVKKDLVSIFKKNGIEALECINKKFDPNFHQAMLEIEDSVKESGIVIQEIQKGYMMKNRLLRPALVGITKKIEEKSKKDEKNNKKS
tara:strand:- start:1393 stop:1998 length:606 start_codon:yes stop_codon:yes gene_type:complete